MGHQERWFLLGRGESDHRGDLTEELDDEHEDVEVECRNRDDDERGPPAAGEVFQVERHDGEGQDDQEITPRICEGMRTTKGKPKPVALVRIVVAR